MEKINLKNIYKTIFVIIGTIIGAGFASGQEIYSFFNIYGIKGIIGIFISAVLISYIIYKTFNIIIKNDINNYQEFLTEIIPKKFAKNRILKFTINNIINIFLLISFNIMISGFATYFLQELNIKKIYGSILVIVLLLIILSKNIEGVVKINLYLIPILIIFIVFLGSKQIVNIDVQSVRQYKPISFILSSVLYASYNSISLVPILISLKKYINNNNEIKFISIINAIILIILSIIIFFLMNSYICEIENIEIPIVYIANMLGSIFKYIYGLVILMAIFTTAVSTGYGFLNNVTKTKKNYNTLLLIICILAIVISQLKFSNLINILYPIFGYLGIIQIIFIIYKTNTLKNKFKFDINK